LAPGVVLTQESVAPPAGPLLVNILRVDLKTPGVRICAELGRDVVLTDEAAKGREAIGSLAARHNAVAAINADFFPYTGDPLGIAIRNGELLSEPMAQRVAFGITAGGLARFDTLLPVGTLTSADGTMFALNGINRPLAKDEIILLTPAYGNRTRVANNGVQVIFQNIPSPIRAGQEYTVITGDVQPGDPNAPIPASSAVLTAGGAGAEWLRAHVKLGDTIRLRIDLAPNPLPAGPPRGDLASRSASLRGRIQKSEWADVEQAVGGGPWLVREGKVAVDGVEEGFSPADFTGKRHPRTAVGVTSTGEVLLVTVDGRRDTSKGFTLPELATYMIGLGAINAINLDGGGSTSMVATSGYVNMPSDGEPRAVADALVVYANVPAVTETTDPPLTLIAGEKAILTGPKGPDGQPIADPVWGTLEGKGFVTMNGEITSTKAGSITAIATVGSARVRISVTIQAGPPSKIKATLTASPNNPPDRNMVSARIVDAYDNPIVGATVEISATRGVVDGTPATTDKDGRVQAEVVWDTDKGRSATVRCGQLSAVTVKAK